MRIAVFCLTKPVLADAKDACRLPGTHPLLAADGVTLQLVEQDKGDAVCDAVDVTLGKFYPHGYSSTLRLVSFSWQYVMTSARMTAMTVKMKMIIAVLFFVRNEFDDNDVTLTHGCGIAVSINGIGHVDMAHKVAGRVACQTVGKLSDELFVRTDGADVLDGNLFHS